MVNPFRFLLLLWRAEQWRDNVAALAEAGFNVYAPTMPGYGRSEKPAVPYGQVCSAVFFL